MKDNVIIKTVDIELRNEHIEITGSGKKEINCWPDIDFDYTVSIGLEIKNDGTLGHRIIDMDVDATAWWIVLAEFMLPLIGSIIVGILESIAGEHAEDAINKSLKINENIADKFSNIPSPFPITAKFHQVQISQNGVFFHGNLDLEEL